MADEQVLDVTYEEFLASSAAPEFLGQIDHISQFSYEAETNFLGGWSDEPSKVRRVIFRLQRSMQEALRLSAFHNQSQLETRRFSDGIEFQYGDPDYGFTYSLDGRGTLRLFRQGSSARRFHEWYRRFMPSLPSLVMETISTIDEELTGYDKSEAYRDLNKEKNRAPVIQVERASYNFRVAIQTSPTNASNRDSIPNIRVLNHSLLRRVPSHDGNLTDPLSVIPEEFGRATYQVNRWRDPDKVLEMYQVAGPSNNEWTMLFFDFAYVGDTYIPSRGERQPFNHKAFVTGAQTTAAYLDFFRDRSVCGFMKGVLVGGKELGPGQGDVGPELTSTPNVKFSTPPSW